MIRAFSDETFEAMKDELPTHHHQALLLLPVFFTITPT